METYTTVIPLGFKAPEFQLPDTITGNILSLNQLKSDKATVLMFICNHCPFVQHVVNELVRLANDYLPKEVSFIGISSNDIIAYPQDSPKEMKKFAELHKFSFPYLYDETQEVAKAYHAACTPDFSIFDKDLLCVYRGRMDGSRPGNNIEVDGREIRSALDNILKGEPVSSQQLQSVGCNIKWKS
ncbi:thioredoxin family protein [Xanthovirga aplysinae]|uniref:thioredoxin family protein n=1 Tax=Xanthovirga aplysinae TaxID=2529853 RepID=UPI0012BCDD5B|nr:thioredoxin family protein [Xanthovirga aplysinae]MTI29417.1 thioredoxin family protein [Xanthovirga aplysinae]